MNIFLANKYGIKMSEPKILNTLYLFGSIYVIESVIYSLVVSKMTIL